MEAHLVRCALLVAAVASLGASYRTPNFVVEAPTPALARQIGQSAEKFRHDLAVEWLGKEMPPWAQPCPITAQVADHLGAGGATSFVFEHGDVFGWRMTIQGSQVRILDSVLPHEVTHTIFATHFRQPLPRWADEGACTTVEHYSERAKQQNMLIDFLRTDRGIAFSRMFAMKDYPHDVMPLYSQGYSVARFLLAQGGKRKFLDFLSEGMRDENWSRATQKFYGIASLDVLQNNWLDWVRKGSPNLTPTKDTPALVAVRTPGPSDDREPQRTDAMERESTLAARAVKSLPGPSDAKASSVYELVSAARSAPRPNDADASGSWRKARGYLPAALAATSDVPPAKKSDEANPQPPVASQYQVTRPQAAQRPRQVILEWSRPPGSEAGAMNATADNRTAASMN